MAFAANEIIRDRRADEVRAVLAVALSLLTQAQREVLAAAVSNNSIQANLALFNVCVPPDEERSGPLLPLLVQGDYAEFPREVHGIVCLLLGIYATNSIAGAKSADLITRAPLAAIPNQKGVAIGSRDFYATDPTVWNSPYGLSRSASRVPPMALYASQGLTPDRIGTGFSGGMSIKGRLGSTIAGQGQSPPMRSAPSSVDAAQLEAELTAEEEVE